MISAMPVEFEVAAQAGGDDDEQQERRDGQPDVDDPPQCQVDQPAMIGREQAHHGADHDAHQPGQQPHLQREAGAQDQHGQQIAALAVGAERRFPGWRLIGHGRERVGEARVDHDPSDQGEKQEGEQEEEPDEKGRAAQQVGKTALAAQAPDHGSLGPGQLGGRQLSHGTPSPAGRAGGRGGRPAPSRRRSPPPARARSHRW